MSDHVNKEIIQKKKNLNKKVKTYIDTELDLSKRNFYD